MGLYSAEDRAVQAWLEQARRDTAAARWAVRAAEGDTGARLSLDLVMSQPAGLSPEVERLGALVLAPAPTPGIDAIQHVVRTRAAVAAATTWNELQVEALRELLEAA